MMVNSDVRVAILLSCYTFESFFGKVFLLDRDHYLKSYRHDWSWLYSFGLVSNGITPIIYIPSLQYRGRFETDVGISVRFLQLANWFVPLSPFGRAMRATRWSLYLQERVNAAALLPELNDAIVADGARVLYVQEYWGGRFDHLAARACIPIVAADHGGLSRSVVKWFKKGAFGRAAALYCQTEDECLIVKKYGGRPTLQPNGCDITFFAPPPPNAQRQKTILTVARLTNRQKRTSDLIRALPLLSEDWRLDIVGVGPDLSFLQSLAQELRVAARVTFHGFKSRIDILAFYQQCGVYAMPSANEAICLAVLEAMSCGAAVVASRIRAFESVICDGVSGLLFPVGDVSALADAIDLAWTARDTLGVRATEAIANNFSSDRLYKQLSESLRRAVA